VLEDKDLFLPGTLVCRCGDRILSAIAVKISDGTLPEYPQVAWLSTLVTDEPNRRRGIGTLLYRRAESELKKAGVKTVLVGGEMHNFFSGIPEPDAEKERFFSSLGFHLNDAAHYDLKADVSKIDFTRCDIAVNETPDFVTRPMMKTDLPAMERFFNEEFPGRWKYEIMNHVASGGDLNEVLLFCRGESVYGFCKIHVSRDEQNGEFNEQLGRNWGALGPIGISKSLRGEGLGVRLLRDSLRYLQKTGAHQVNIDWTILKDFYGQFGFLPWRTFLAAYKDL
jgi:predicted N-acetyltransferase YhbS